MTIQTVKPNPKWLYALDTIDSTNNYAIKLIEDGLAQNGDIVWALEQTAGKGQRGKSWETNPGENIMMSLIILANKVLADNPFHLNVIVAQTITSYFQQIHQYWKVQIKWPNDIFINAKKTAGILIENIYRGSNWTNAIIGIGINTNQDHFPNHLNNATSIKKEAGMPFDLLEIITDLRAGILNALIHYNASSFDEIMATYNQNLFGLGEKRAFRLKDDESYFEAKVLEVDNQGLLVLETKEGILKCASGSLQWQLNS